MNFLIGKYNRNPIEKEQNYIIEHNNIKYYSENRDELLKKLNITKYELNNLSKGKYYDYKIIKWNGKDYNNPLTLFR